MRALLAEVDASGVPLRGIIHAAGVAPTAPLATLSLEQLLDTLRPKAMGGWTLHQLTQDRPLDFLVFFSSAAAAWGAVHAAAYAAANQALDALAHHRRAQGLPALSIGWGRWPAGGVISTGAERLFDEVGLQVLPARAALEALRLLLGGQAPQQLVASVDWRRFQPIYETKRRRPLLEGLRPSEPVTASGPGSRSSFLTGLEPLASEQRALALEEQLRRRLAEVLGGEPSGRDISLHRGFFEMGMTSMMAVSLKRLLEADLGLALPTTLAFEHPSIEALTRYLSGLVAPPAPLPPVADVTSPEPTVDSSTTVDSSMAEEDLAQLLSAKLAAFASKKS
jgi:myxalamid-type polyketide synthase MxaE and MxaD